jgi:hypothetical protein
VRRSLVRSARLASAALAEFTPSADLENTILRATLFPIFLIAVALTACANPLWRFDRYHVQGEFRGRRCFARLDGTDVTGPSGWSVRIDQRTFPGSVFGSIDTVQTLSCGQSLIALFARDSSVKTSATFRVVNTADGHVPIGSATMLFDVADLRDVPWDAQQFAGKELRGASGTLMIDRVVGDSVFGSFDFVARRAVRAP